MKKVLLILTFLFFLIPTSVFAYDHEITKYNIDIIVNEDNTLNIEEEITAKFNTYKHGIYRYIPLSGQVIRLDGTSKNYKTKIKQISVDEEYETYTENGNKVIQIGDPNTTIIGEKTYKISYLYDIGRDTNKGFDEVYFNVIGNGWNTTLSNVEFTITMPKDYVYDEKNFGLSTGTYGTEGTTNAIVEEGENKVTVRLTETLQPTEGVTVRLTLPDNYFVRPYFTTTSIVIPMVSITLAIIGYVLWKKYGDDKEVVEPVEFYSPDGYNSAELGYIYKNLVDNKDIVSLLIYLANKGYLTIEEKGKANFILTKVKDYDGINEIERIFLDGLFEKKISVEKKDLENSFYKTINSISLHLPKVKEKVYEKSWKVRLIIGTLIFINCILSLGYFLLKEEMAYFTTSIFVIIFIIVISTILSLSVTKAKKGYKKLVFITSLILLVPTIVSIFLFFIVTEPKYLLVFTVSNLATLILINSFIYASKRTAYGDELIGRIRGFRNFLEVAEKEKLEMLVEEDPTYFYNILPFTYIFGLSDKWIKKFEGIALEQPEWYNTNTTSTVAVFNVNRFNTFVNKTMTTATTAMTSSPNTSSSGRGNFSGGGGFSGGGFGGGGGGSW